MEGRLNQIETKYKRDPRPVLLVTACCGGDLATVKVLIESLYYVYAPPYTYIIEWRATDDFKYTTPLSVSYWLKLVEASLSKHAFEVTAYLLSVIPHMLFCDKSDNHERLYALLVKYGYPLEAVLPDWLRIRRPWGRIVSQAFWRLCQDGCTQVAPFEACLSRMRKPVGVLERGFLLACQRGHSETVAALLRLPTQNYYSRLHEQCLQTMAAAAAIQTSRLDILARCKRSAFIEMEVCERGDVSVARWLLENNWLTVADIQRRFSNEMTARTLIRRHHRRLFAWLIEKGFPVTGDDIILACQHSHSKMLTQLLQANIKWALLAHSPDGVEWVPQTPTNLLNRLENMNFAVVWRILTAGCPGYKQVADKNSELSLSLTIRGYDCYADHHWDANRQTYVVTPGPFPNHFQQTVDQLRAALPLSSPSLRTLILMYI